MSQHRRSHCFSMAILFVAVLLLVTLSGAVRQPAVTADSASKLAGLGKVQDSVGDIRRPLVKLAGWVYESEPTHLLIGDHVLRVDAASRTAGDATVGDYAVARASVDQQGQLYAEDVTVLPLPEVDEDSVSARAERSAQQPGSPGYPIEFRGVIQEVDPRYWLVDSRMVFITVKTSIEGRPEVGALAEVKGFFMFDNIVLANSIKVAAPGAYAEVEFEGIIESIADDVWVVNGATVRISPVTVIEGTPAVGAIAEVQGVLQPDGSVLAQRIIITYPGFPLLSDVEGLVESMETTHWVISSVSVLVDSSTFIDDSRAPAEVGMWALARGLPQQDGSLLAVRILLSRPD
jgi:hypothetical protein